MMVGKLSKNLLTAIKSVQNTNSNVDELIANGNVYIQGKNKTQQQNRPPQNRLGMEKNSEPA